MTVHYWPTPTHYLNLLNHSWPSNHLVVYLISGQGYFTFLYGHTKHNIHNQEGGRKENKQSRTLVSSKRKKGEVCDTFTLLSVHLWASMSVYSSEIPTRPPGMLTHPLTLANLASESTGPSSCSLLPTALFCLPLSTASFCSAWDLPSLVLFWSRGKYHAQALCVGFTPKQAKRSSDWHPQKQMSNIMPHTHTYIYIYIVWIVYTQSTVHGDC